MPEKDVEILQAILEAMVDNPDSIKTERKIDEMGVLLTFEVAKEDRGMVIGRQGQTIQAIRTILRVIGAKNKARVNLQMIEPDKPERARKSSLDELNL